MKTCPKCEHNNDEDAMHCSVCGTSLKTSFPFLNNVYQGKNSWWRYFFTIVATWGIQIVLGFIIGIILVLVLIMQGDFSMTRYNEYLFNPFFALSLTFVGFLASYLIFYIFTRFVQLKKFTSLITIESKINWRRILKGAGVWLAILGIYTLITLLI